MLKNWKQSIFSYVLKQNLNINSKNLTNLGTIAAFTAGGDLTLGAYKLKTTTLYFAENTANYYMAAKLISDNSLKGLIGNILAFTSSLSAQANAAILDAYSIDDSYLIGRAKDSGVGNVEVFRMQGDVDPEFQLGNAGNALRASNAGKLGFFTIAPQAQPTGVAVTAAGIHAALVTLGLIAA